MLGFGGLGGKLGKWNGCKESRDSLGDLRQRGVDRQLPKIADGENQSATPAQSTENTASLDLVHGAEEPEKGID